MEDGAAAEAEDALSARAVMQQQPHLRGFKALGNLHKIAVNLELI